MMLIPHKQSGTKLIRGWDEVIKYLDKKGKRDSVSSVGSSKERTDNISPTSENESPKIEVDMDEDDGERVIDHLVFVIHGYEYFCRINI